jgi:hypothetical protein
METLLVFCVFLLLFVYLKIKKRELFLNLEQVLMECKLGEEASSSGPIQESELNADVENQIVQNYLKTEGLQQLYQNQEFNFPIDTDSLMADEFLIAKLKNENTNQLDKNLLTLQNIEEQLKVIDKVSLPLPMLNEKYE